MLKTASVLTLLIFVFSVQGSFGQSLPAKIRNYLDRKYSSWELSPSTADCTAEHPNKGIVDGDFDGDKKTDYAVKIVREKKGYIIAFLHRQNNYRAFVLHNYSADDAKHQYLTLYRKGEVFRYTTVKGWNEMRLRNDAPTDYFCESDVGGIHYFRNGKFIGY